jgi:hypothetical protein
MRVTDNPSYGYAAGYYPAHSYHRPYLPALFVIPTLQALLRELPAVLAVCTGAAITVVEPLRVTPALSAAGVAGISAR